MATRRTDYQKVARTIIDVARRAPSVCNTQPWTWSTDGADLELRADPARRLTGSDPEGRLLTVSCGAALHYATTAATAMGWDTRVDLLPRPEEPDLLALLRLAPGHVLPGATAVLDSLSQRHTDRRPFTSWPLPHDLVRGLVETVRLPGVVVSAVTEPALRRRVEQLIEEARLAQERDPRLAEDTDTWTDRPTPDGVPSTVARAGKPSGRSNLQRWPTRFDRGPVPRPPAPTASTAGGLLVVGTSEDDAAAWLRAGIALTGLWLRATADGLAVVPLSQVVELEAGRRALADEVFAGRWHPQVAARIGWPEIGRDPLPGTPRRTVEDVLRRRRARAPMLRNRRAR